MLIPWHAAQFCEYTPPPFDAWSAVNAPGVCAKARQDSAIIPNITNKNNLDKSAECRIPDLLISNSI